MNSGRIYLGTAAVALAGLGWVLGAIGSEPQGNPQTSKEQAGKPRITLAVAQDRAKVMHQIYAATLEVMHDRYFHGDRATVPARALEDVFTALEEPLQSEARWISVNTKPMSLHHEPTTDFDKQAAAAITAGKEDFELVSDGYYRRAAAIPLTGGCVSCHAGFFATPPKSPRFAALVIEIPLDEK